MYPPFYLLWEFLIYLIHYPTIILLNERGINKNQQNFMVCGPQILNKTIQLICGEKIV